MSKTDFDKTGILHLYTARPIKRVLVGDFHGDHYSQTCAITDDNMLNCYGISTDRTGNLIAAAHFNGGFQDLNPIVEIYSAQTGQLVLAIGPGGNPELQP